MRFVVDAQLPPALAVWLIEQGFAAEHVCHIGLLDATDAIIADYVDATSAILVSKDADFITLRLPDRFGFVWLRCGNATNRALRDWLAPRWRQILALLDAGERLIEVR